MTDESSFLLAIRESPADDLPRMAYADWLDERDALTDWQAATRDFIRLSCGYWPDSIPAQGWWVRNNWERLFAVASNNYGATNLANLDGKMWLSFPLTPAPLSGVSLNFARGFVQEVAMSGSEPHLETLLPYVCERCPVAELSLGAVCGCFGPVGDPTREVRVYDFAPRAVWNAVRGHTDIGSEGTSDYKIFAAAPTVAENYAFARAELSRALRWYGERAPRKLAPA